MSILRHAKQCLSSQSKYTHLNAFVSLADRTAVLSYAESADNAIHTSKPDAPFGDLVAIKDNICTVQLPTTAASGALKSFTSPYDATVVKQLREAGAIIAGKTNMDEFGMGSHSTHSYFGPVKQLGNQAEELSVGGSSGGSALAVALGQCTTALGTDTGGSVRLPAAYTGIVGFKPSYGLLSRWGVIAYANSLDTIGIFSSQVEQARTLFTTLNTHDPQDPTSLSQSTRSRLGRTLPNTLRIGIPLEYNISTLDPTIKSTWLHTLRTLESAGHTLYPVSLPATRHALSAYYILAPAEASSNLAKYDGVRYGSRAEGIDGTPTSVLFAKTRGQNLGQEVQRRILLGAFSLSAQAIDNYFIQAQKIRRLVQGDFNNVFATPNPLLTSETSVASREGVDVIVCPTAPTPAPLYSSIADQDSIDAYMNDVFTVPASLAGLPAISVPVRIPTSRDLSEEQEDGSGRKESVGIQIIGQYGEDEFVLDVAQKIVEMST
ncbi:glutamyl-tRNA amidotransferase-like protein [Dendryphion nanum]|uniref:Glutamyl-tRNA(Gln) amidotransferase subunit A, mitochondrial n=1 Tax=Dendryphion nanum TaxID=256645 RepID=A0A9P9EG74_9PLEO|nr:glutamyl-tRNA amidotransferase-like protein [Dendryphion nanum]